MKILYVTTISNTLNAFLIPHIKALLDEGHQVDVACNLVQPLDAGLLSMGCKIYKVPFSRSPINKNNYNAFRRLKEIQLNENYEIMHTHTPIASAIVRLLRRHLDSFKVIYTAHGFHFFEGAPMINWVIYYPIEKWLSKYTDVLITINSEDYHRASNKMQAGRVEQISGIGFDTKVYMNRNTSKLRKSLKIENEDMLLISVGELNANKNHITLIRALKVINAPDIHLVVCGEGPLRETLLDEVKHLGLENQVTLLGFRRDVKDWLHSSDVFLFPSKREGLGIAALEAMASGLPIITSNVHGITDYSKSDVTGYLYDPKDVSGFAEGIKKLKNSKDLRLTMGSNNVRSVLKYDITNVLSQMSIIYSEVQFDG